MTPSADDVTEEARAGGSQRVAAAARKGLQGPVLPLDGGGRHTQVYTTTKLHRTVQKATPPSAPHTQDTQTHSVASSFHLPLQPRLGDSLKGTWAL